MTWSDIMGDGQTSEKDLCQSLYTESIHKVDNIKFEGQLEERMVPGQVSTPWTIIYIYKKADVFLKHPPFSQFTKQIKIKLHLRT